MVQESTRTRPYAPSHASPIWMRTKWPVVPGHLPAIARIKTLPLITLKTLVENSANLYSNQCHQSRLAGSVVRSYLAAVVKFYRDGLGFDVCGAARNKPRACLFRLLPRSFFDQLPKRVGRAAGSVARHRQMAVVCRGAPASRAMTRADTLVTDTGPAAGRGLQPLPQPCRGTGQTGLRDEPRSER